MLLVDIVQMPLRGLGLLNSCDLGGIVEIPFRKLVSVFRNDVMVFLAFLSIAAPKW